MPTRAELLSDRCKAVLLERSAARYEEEDGGRRFLVCLFPIGENTIVSSGIDITDRRRAEEAVEQALQADRAEKEWLTAVLNSMNEEVYFTDRERRYSYANPAALREFGYDGIEGADVRQIVSRLEVLRPDGSIRPVEEAPPLRALGGEVIRDEEQLVRIPRTGELRHRQVSSAPVRDAGGSIIGSVSVVRDVTRQKRIEATLRAREARSSALLRLADKFRTLTTPADLAFAAAEMLGETLGVSRCGYGTIDPVAETITIERDWNAPGIKTIAGVLRFREYGTYIEELKRGETVVCVDARTDPRTRATASALELINARSFVNMPVTEAVGVVALLYLNHENARVWTEEELSFIREVAERTRVTVERRRSEQALASDLRFTNLLRGLAARLVGEGNVQVLFDAILDAAIEITGADAGTIQLLDERTHVPRFVAIRGLAEDLTRHFEEVDASSGSSCGMALARQARVVLDFSDAEAEDPDGARRLHRQYGLHSAQSTPLVSRSGRALGMFSTHWRCPHTLTERELRFLDLLARQATDLIERTQVEQSIRSSEQQLRAAAVERERLLESERAARAEAERLGRMKDEFLATLSHELRTPLNSILGWASLMRGGAREDHVRGLEIIERNARAQSKIITELLEMSSIVSGKIQLEARPVNLAQVLTSATDATRPSADAKGIHLRVTLDAAATGVRGDAGRLQQVFWNLLTNAVKFTPAGGSVDVVVRRVDSMMEISVTDTGVGIKPEFLPHVFERFRQADSSITRRYGGLGLGLALVKQLVELHGGSATAMSEGEGRGSTFTVTLPVAMDLEPPQAEQLAVSKFDQSIAELPSLAGITALVVDDDADARELVSSLIERSGGRAIPVGNAKEALSALDARSVDVLVSDIGMPEMDGYTLIQQVRSSGSPQARVMPAIALTAYATADERQRVLLAGYQMHLSKPVELRELIAGIATLLRLSKHVN